MRVRWTMPTAVALLALAVGVLLSQGAGQAQMPAADLVVTKSVQPSLIAPGEMVIYTVELSNTAGVTLELSSLVDTLADGFEYIGLAPGSEWGVEPWDRIPPQIQWAGPITVPMSDTLIVRYYVYVRGDVPLSPSPYMNTVVATSGGHSYTAQTGLLVAKGKVTVEKAADPDRVKPGELVTYTVTFHNSGYVPVPLAVVTDTLPTDVTFVTMTANSDLSAPPVGVSGTITWPGPMTIPSHGEFMVEYQTAMPVTSDTLHLQNEVWGQLGDGTIVGPAGAGVVVATSQPMTVTLPLIYRDWAPPAFAVTKTANPTTAYAQTPGALITYTVTFVNEGTVPGVLADIRDTLPAGFTFMQMLPGSDVSAAPSGISGQIIWTGPFTVNGRSSLKLLYQVRASSTAGTYTNSATATVTKGRPPQAPASATVTLLVPIYLVDTFDHNVDNWTDFLNKPNRLRPEQWYWDASSGHPGGCLSHNRYLGNPPYPANDALTMYLQPGAEQWTDYRFEADVWMSRETPSFALWFRGHYQDSADEGNWVLGYYLNVNPGHKWVEIWQTQTELDCVADTCTTPGWQYDFSNPMLLYRAPEYPMPGFKESWHRVAVEVRNVANGVNMKGFIDGVQALEFTDTQGTIILNGTVGFATYQAPLLRFDNVQVTPLY